MRIKFFSLLLALCFIISAVPFAASAETSVAANMVELGIDSNVVNVEPGEEFTLNFEVKKNSGISFLWLEFIYDMDVFEYVSHTNDDLFDGSVIYSKNNGKLSYFFNAVTSVNSNTGRFVSITFKAKKAYCGETKISAKLNQDQPGNCSKYSDRNNNEHVPFVGCEATYTVHSYGNGNVCSSCGASNCVTGDINGDKAVDILDLVRLKGILAGIAQSTGASADVDGNGAVNSLDIISLRKLV